MTLLSDSSFLAVSSMLMISESLNQESGLNYYNYSLSSYEIF
jgi:hypothetical protein